MSSPKGLSGHRGQRCRDKSPCNTTCSEENKNWALSERGRKERRNSIFRQRGQSFVLLSEEGKGVTRVKGAHWAIRESRHAGAGAGHTGDMKLAGQARARGGGGLGSGPQTEGSQPRPAQQGPDDGRRAAWELANNTDSQPRPGGVRFRGPGVQPRNLFLTSSSSDCEAGPGPGNRRGRGAAVEGL